MPFTYDRVLVTGGAGFIGSHTVDALLEEDCKVWVLDNLSSGHLRNLVKWKDDQRLHFRKGTVTDHKTVGSITRKVDAVVHLAAVLNSDLSIHDPQTINEVNVTGTLSILSAAVKNQVGRVVFASSAAVYGDVDRIPVAEDAPARPITSYGVSKLAAEQYCLAHYSTYGLSTIALRYFNVYGERQGSNAYSGVIAIFRRQLAEHQRPIIYGNGEQKRDFIHISDVVRANLSALNTKKGVGEAYNIGTGQATTITELAYLMTQIMSQQDLTPRFAAPRKWDIKDSCASVKKAQDRLGFHSKIQLKEGLKLLLGTSRPRC